MRIISRRARARGPGIRILFASLVALVIVPLLWATTAHAQSDFRGVRQLISGGFGLWPRDYPPYVMTAAKGLGTRRARILSFDAGMLKAVSPDGALDIKWSDPLEEDLRICKQQHWMPRFLWGLYPPRPLMRLHAPRGGAYGPDFWAGYDRYTTALLNHVANDWGIHDFEIEVDNEMDGRTNVNRAWFMPNARARKADTRITWRGSLASYMVLYAHVSSTVRRYTDAHPGITIRVGGPAATNMSYYVPAMKRPDYFNWLGGFVDAAVAQNLPLDFVSWHIYDGYPHSGQDALSSITGIRRHLQAAGSSAKISIDEWGYAPGDNPGNQKAIAGAYALDFIYRMDQVHMDDAMYLVLVPQILHGHHPALFYAGSGRAPWDQTYALIAMTQLYQLSQGRRLECQVVGLPLACFSAQMPDGLVRTMFWGFNSMDDEAVNRWHGKSPITVRITGLSGSSHFRGFGLNVNGQPHPELASRVVLTSQQNGFTARVIGIGPGDFARLTLSH